MLLTNRCNLPEEVVNALTKNRYQSDDESQDAKTDYSISNLTAPTQQTILRKRYPEGNTEDVIDRFFTLYGHLAHQLLEEHGSDESITEKRFYINIHGKTISGQIDHYKARKITDYKTVGAYKVQTGEFDDWEKQQNCYSHLCEENGLAVDSIRIIAFIRDWSKSDAARGRSSGYPEAPIKVIPLVKWKKEIRVGYIEQRVLALNEAEQLPDNKLPECSDKERWIRFKNWGVVKDGAEKAAKVFCKEDEIGLAKADAARRGPSFKVVRRTSEPRRCLEYCNVSSVCHQFKQYLQQNEKPDIKNPDNINWDF